MSFTGQVESVVTDPAGDEVAVDTPAGAGELVLVDASDFNPAGGTIIITDDAANDGDGFTQSINYVAVDEETDTITLDGVTDADLVQGAQVTIYPEAPRSTAYVRTDDDLEPLPTYLPQETRANYITQLEDGEKGTDGVSVIVEEVAGVPTVVQVVDTAVQFDAQRLVGPIPEGSTPHPTEPPSDPPVITVGQFAIGALLIDWEPVERAEWYEVAASLSAGFDPDTNIELENLTDTRAMVAAVDNNQIPTDGTPVYVRVRAVNVVGAGPWSAEGSGVAREADVEFLSALFAWFGTIEARSALLGTLDVIMNVTVGGLIQIGPRITIGDPLRPDGKGGIIIWGDDAQTIIKARLHPDSNYLDGILVAQDITVMRALRLIGKLSAIASGARVTIENGVADPAAPSLSQGPVLTDWPAPPAGYTQKGIAWDPAGTQWVRLLQNESTKRGHVQPVSTAGVAGTRVALGVGTALSGLAATKVSGITVLGSDVYYTQTGYSSAFNEVSVKLIKCALSTGTVAANTEIGGDNGSTYPGEAALGTDGTNVYAVIAGDGSFGGLGATSVLRYNTSLGQTGGTTLTGANANDSRRFCAVTDLGYGGAKLTVAYATHVDVYAAPAFTGGSSVAKDTALSWDMDASVFTGGIAYKTSGSDLGFYSTHNDLHLSRWDSYYPAAGENAYAQYADTGGGNTTLVGPESDPLPLGKRRYVTVALNPAPDGVTGADVFVGYGTTSPGIVKKKRLEPISQRTMTLTSGKISGSDTFPSTNTMGGSPGELVDSVSYAVTNKALTSNVATLTVSAHTLTVGQVVTVAIGDAVFDGEKTVTAVTETGFSYAKTNANVASASASGLVQTWKNRWAGDDTIALGGLTVPSRLSGPLAATGNYTGTVNAIRKADIVHLEGTVSRPTSSSSSFEDTGVVLPVGFRPVSQLLLPASTIWGSSVLYQFRLETDGRVTVRMSGAATNSMTLDAVDFRCVA